MWSLQFFKKKKRIKNFSQWSIKKNKGNLFEIIVRLYFFDSTLFRGLGKTVLFVFGRIWFPFEIFWPLEVQPWMNSYHYCPHWIIKPSAGQVHLEMENIKFRKLILDSRLFEDLLKICMYSKYCSEFTSYPISNELMKKLVCTCTRYFRFVPILKKLREVLKNVKYWTSIVTSDKSQ